MAQPDVHGPVDFLLLEFPSDSLTGQAAEELLALVDRGTISVYDVLVVGKDKDGVTYGLDLAELVATDMGGFSELAGARSGLLSDEDMEQAAAVLEPGRLAVLLVYENTWAIPFVAAARESGGELIAGARIPAQDVMDALDDMESRSVLETTTS